MPYYLPEPPYHHDQAARVDHFGGASHQSLEIALIAHPPEIRAELGRLAQHQSRGSRLHGGLVTDLGGPLAHGSIVAREYGIPAVMGTGSATQRIHDGEIITVDGTAGRVTHNGQQN